MIENCEDPELLLSFWHTIEKVTILDPACGSGAFLFAALNILEPLYEACLDRMEAFVEDLDRSGEKHFAEKVSDFRKVLARVAAHPNRRYFIFKSIILNNLFGVDIMEEAVEICKLRLFLKLAAQVEPDTTHDNLGIEPLPDIDFNIKAGNTLVGFATHDDAKRAIASKFDFDNAMEKIAVKAADLQQAFDAFRERQVESDGSVPMEYKLELRKRLSELQDELSRYLAAEYGVDPTKKNVYVKWLKSHHPFHWFVEFYGIMSSGGFDVIIGNPPYVEYRKAGLEYRIQHDSFTTEECGNLLAYTSERSTTLIGGDGRLGLVLLVSTFSTERMRPLQDHLHHTCSICWVSNYAWRPSKLFDGANTINAILLAAKGPVQEGRVLSTKYMKWSREERESLFQTIKYGEATEFCIPGSFPKVASVLQVSIARKIRAQHTPLHNFFAGTNPRNCLYYFRGMLYWIKVLDSLPVHREDGTNQVSGQCKTVLVTVDTPAHAVISVMSSSLFFWFYQTFSDCQQINKREFIGFKWAPSPEHVTALTTLGRELMRDYKRNSNVVTRHIHSRSAVIEKEYFEISKSKLLIDSIDCELARHYSLTEEELDFIIN